MCPCPDGGEETYILCRSRDRREKEQAMHARFEKRIEEGLTKIAAGCGKRRAAGGADRATRGTLAGTKHAGRGLVRHSDSGRCQGRRAGYLEEGRDVASLGAAQRRLVCAAQQRDRLERRRPVAGVHPIDRRGDGVPHSEERFIATSGVASKRGPRAGPHSGLLPGLRAVEVPGPTLPEGRIGKRTAARCWKN